MSQENVEALRWLYGEWAKGKLWALTDIADPQIEWEWGEAMASVYGGPRVYRGLKEIGAATLEWLEPWDAYWMTAEEFFEADDEVVVFMRVHAQGGESDRVIEQRIAAVWEMRDGRAMRVRYYEDRAQALKAVGLSE
jgi:ketosteroid isomerase-like protein